MTGIIVWLWQNLFEQVNRDRQTLEKQIFDEAVSIVESTMNPEEKKIIVVASENWHHGVIGIVASKLVERYYRPVIILAIEDGIASGSARSVEGFSIFDALMANKPLFRKFGGHGMAAGMSLDQDKVEALDKGLNDYAEKVMDQQVLIPKLKADLTLDLDRISIDLIENIQAMEPFGIGNREPAFICKGNIKSIRKIGKDQSHLQVEIEQGTAVGGVAFSMAELSDRLRPGQPGECVCTLDINEWRNIRKPQLMVKDLRHSNDFRDAMRNVLMEHRMTDYMDPAVEINFTLSRDDYSKFYRFLMELDRSKIWHVSYGQLMEREAMVKPSQLTKCFIMLEVFSEVGLLSYELLEDAVGFELFNVKKVALDDSKLYNKLL